MDKDTKESTSMTGGVALRRAATTSLILAVIKGSAFAFSGSLIVLASFMDSLMDFLTSATNLKVFQFARLGADDEHPFGHGGFEVIGSLIQGILLLFFGGSIALESVRKVSSAVSIDFTHLEFIVGVITLVFSAFGGLFISRFLAREIRDTDVRVDRSLAVLADNAHYLGDVYFNLLSAAGLAAAFYSGAGWIDPAFAGVAGLFLMRSAFPIIRKCFVDIVHQEVDPKLQAQIAEIVLFHDERITGIHHLRTRELGPHLFVDFHLALSGDISLQLAHQIGEDVENVIKAAIPRADVMIHLDPHMPSDDHDWVISNGVVENKTSRRVLTTNR